jgi:hypothetical protein
LAEREQVIVKRRLAANICERRFNFRLLQVVASDGLLKYTEFSAITQKCQPKKDKDANTSSLTSRDDLSYCKLTDSHTVAAPVVSSEET